MAEILAFWTGYQIGRVYRSIVDKLLGVLEWITRPVEEGMNP